MIENTLTPMLKNYEDKVCNIMSKVKHGYVLLFELNPMSSD